MYYKSSLQSRATYSRISSCKLSFLHFSLRELRAMVKQWRLLGFRGRWQADYGVETSCVSIILPSALHFIASRLLCDISVLPPWAGLWSAPCSTCCGRSWKLGHQSTGAGGVASCPLGWSVPAWALSLPPEELRCFLLSLKKASWWNLKSLLKCYHFMLSVEILLKLIFK